MGSAKRFFTLFLVLVCLMTCIPLSQAQGVNQYPTQFYLTQLDNGTCTLCSATMMVRSALLRNGTSGWMNATELALRRTGWTVGVGLKWNFTYSDEEAVVKVAHNKVNGFTVESLKALLDEHPEGIVFYAGKVPHAVFLLGYEGDTFYCAETVTGYSGQTITLADSWIGKKYDNDQAKALANATAYWYIERFEWLDTTDCSCSGLYAGTYTCTASSLRIRSGHGTDFKTVGTIPSGAAVTVTKVSADGWAHVQYNGLSGYASMEYLSLNQYSHNYQSTVTPATCTAGGYTIHTCADCGHSLMDTHTAALGHSYGDWTAGEPGKEIRTCIRCDATETRDAEVRGQMGTVTGNSLRIRENAGTAYKTLGYLNKGDRVEILEQKQVGSTTWGRIAQGWISMDYVKLDEPVAEPPAEEPPVTEPPAETQPEQTTVMGTVTGSSLRIRENAGTSYKTLGYLNKGDRVEILETATVNGMSWGRISQGWISLDYVKLDEPAAETPEQNRVVTVNTSCLRIRKEPTTASAITGYLYRGAKVEILETKDVNGTTWGRTEKGWISMDYVI